MSGSVLPMFSYRSFIVSGLTFRSLIHFKFIFVYGVRKCSSFILLQVVDQFPSTTCQRDCLIDCILLPLLSKISVNRCVDLCLGFLSYLTSLYFCFFVCQYHPVLMTISLQYNRKSGKLILLVLFFFIKIPLAIWVSFCVLPYRVS